MVFREELFVILEGIEIIFLILMEGIFIWKGDGENIFFWDDICMNLRLLKELYLRLYDLFFD